MIHLIHESLGRLLDEKLKPLNLTHSQSSVMAFLRARKGQPVSITEIKEELGVSAPTALGLVRRLEKKQYVSVYTDKRDQRVRLVVYNNQHLEPVEKSFVNASSVEEQMMSGFTSEEREQFIEYLNRAYQNIR
ncbi:MAG: MarR family transcriptional regulator [Clostridia bacterium]|nr:MarR family transcriptional regulator [Clostridia bacterium]